MPASININTTAINVVKAELDSSATSLPAAVNNAVVNSVNTSGSTLQSAIDARATAKATTQVNSIKNTLLTAQDLINLINSGALTIGTDNKVTFGNVSIDANDQNYNSQAGTLHKLHVTYSCINTQQCSTGTVPDLITNP